MIQGSLEPYYHAVLPINGYVGYLPGQIHDRESGIVGAGRLFANVDCDWLDSNRGMVPRAGARERRHIAGIDYQCRRDRDATGFR